MLWHEADAATRLGCVALVFASGCFHSRKPAPAADAGPPPACDDADQTRHDGCVPCDAVDPEACYDGPEGTEGVGVCRTGFRSCRDGVWTRCGGEVVPTDETCDTEDDDCDGVVDDGVLSACGDCNANCHMVCAGVGCAGELEAGAGASRTEEGSVRSGSENLTPRRIWIPDAAHDLVYAIATATHEPLAAYAIPSAEGSFLGDVAMDLRGNAFVLRIGAPLVTRIDAGDCVDLDGDGVVETSTGPVDILEDDECVRWSAVPECDACGFARSIALTDGGRAVWVGLQDPDLLVQLDPETGESTGVEAQVFGQPWAMVPSRDGLWVSTFTQLCAVTSAGDLDACHRLPRDTFVRRIDFDSSGLVYGVPGLLRFDPLTEAFETIAAPGSSVAIDEAGNVWTVGEEGNESFVLTRYRPGHDPDAYTLAHSAFEVAADLDDQLWTTSWSQGSAYVLDSAGTELAALFDGCDGRCLGDSSLSADPTSIRLRRAFPERLEYGEARATFEAECDPTEFVVWNSVRWQSAEPGGLALDVRTAATAEGLPAQRWVPLVDTDEATGETPLAGISDAPQPWLEFRARQRGRDVELQDLEVIWGCYQGDF